MIATLWLGLLASEAQACERGYSLKALIVSIERAETAHARVDVEGLHGAADEVRERLPCLGEPVGPGDAARVHRVEGLSRFADGDREGAAMAFAAARTLDPDWMFPVEQVPEGHPLRVVYGELPVTGAAYEGLPEPPVGEVWVDGAVRRGRPRDWPAVVQVVGEEGILLGAYLWPDDPFPDLGDGGQPLPLFAAEGFVPPTREDRPEGLPERLEHRRDEVRIEALVDLERDPDATAWLLWVLFTDRDHDVRFKAWRVLRARTRKGFGNDRGTEAEAVRWLAEHGKGAMKAEAIQLLERLPTE